jgi:N-acetylmuramic acid 6-phosphate etherase
LREISTTESSSNYNNLEEMSVYDILSSMNSEDLGVAKCVQENLHSIEKLVNLTFVNLNKGGRVFYLGAGTSGRLGILDASECPPTFGVSHELFIGLIAGGDKAIRKAVEFAEDDPNLGWKDLLSYNVNQNDTVIGLAASGKTPYVVGALKEAQKNNILTGCITCNKNSLLSKYSDVSIEIVVGPEFISGSTRLKSGTAQKMVLNMLSTSLMIKLGKVIDNKMVDMALSNKKLLNRGAKIISDKINVSEKKALELLKKFGSVRQVLDKKKYE